MKTIYFLLACLISVSTFASGGANVNTISAIDNMNGPQGKVVEIKSAILNQVETWYPCGGCTHNYEAVGVYVWVKRGMAIKEVGVVSPIEEGSCVAGKKHVASFIAYDVFNPSHDVYGVEMASPYGVNFSYIQCDPKQLYAYAIDADGNTYYSNSEDPHKFFNIELRNRKYTKKSHTEGPKSHPPFMCLGVGKSHH